MKGARAVAAVATVGNLLNGWDSAMLAGALLYIEPEYDLDDQPVLEGMVAAASLVGAAISSTFAGSGADRLGRRSIMCVSAVIFCIGALLMVWSPNVYMLLVARLIDGVGVGLAVTVAPMYISEVAPSEIRGKLNTLPQLAGTAGMFLAYCVSFGMSLSSSPSWRLMLGILLIPSLVYLTLGIFYLPESPRWLVSKGKMKEARQVLQLLRNTEDVSGEMAMLVEGLGVGEDASLEEYFIEPAEFDDKDDAPVSGEPHIKIFTPGDDGTSWIAKSTSGISESQQLLSRPGSILRQSTPNRQSFPFMDPVISLMGRASGNFTESLADFDNERKDEDNVDRGRVNEISGWDEVGEENLRSPLLSRQTTDQLEEEDLRGVDPTMLNNTFTPGERQHSLQEESIKSPLLSRQTTTQLEEEDDHRTESMISRATSIDRVTPRERKNSLFPQSSLPENIAQCGSLGGFVGSRGIGDGWKLVWQWTGPEGTEGKAGQGEFKRVYLHQEKCNDGSRMGSTHSLPCFSSIASNLAPIQAAALVSRPSQRATDIDIENQVGPALVHPAESAKRGLTWSGLLEGGIRQALIVGVVLQILEQFGGINGVLNYTPTILEESGVEILLSGIGITSNSASLLSSAVVELISLPCILIAMQLMDKLGRRAILLRTVPILIIALLALIIINIVPANAAVFSVISISGVIVFLSVFVMGFGPIPNMLCAEIFPTRVRGVCIGICQAAMWLSNIIVTELFPLLDDSIGIAGSFAIFAVFCAISWIFIFLKVPETKGMPLEVIVEFFAMSAAGTKTSAKMDVHKDIKEQV